jgi:hypothetical protein
VSIHYFFSAAGELDLGTEKNLLINSRQSDYVGGGGANFI